MGSLNPNSKSFGDHLGIKLSKTKLKELVKLYHEEGTDDPSLSNNVLGLPARYEMTERQQMLFVIKGLRETLRAIESAPGFYIDWNELIEDLPDLELLQSYYTFFGEYNDWEFKD